jgi:hypothetical protein
MRKLFRESFATLHDLKVNSPKPQRQVFIPVFMLKSHKIKSAQQKRVRTTEERDRHKLKKAVAHGRRKKRTSGRIKRSWKARRMRSLTAILFGRIVEISI